MRARLWKEVRQLAPAWYGALALVILPFALPWSSVGEFLGTSRRTGMDLSSHWISLNAVAFIVALVFLALSSVGRELTHRTLPLLLSQPVSRQRLWREKIGVLTAATVLVWLVFWTAFTGTYEFSLWTGALALASAFGIMSTGLWTTLVLRQVVPAICFSILVPAMLVPLIEPMTELPSSLRAAGVALMALYAAGGYLFARWLFLRAQDLQPEAYETAWSLRRPAPAPATGLRTRRRGVMWNLAAKEIRLQQVNFLSAVALFFVVGLLTIILAHGEKRTGFDGAIIVLALVALLMPLLAGSGAIAEERKLGTLESQQILPVSKWRQFLVKVTVTYSAILSLGLLLPLLVFFVIFRATGISPGAGASIEFGLREVIFLALYALLSGTVALYLSSFSRNSLAALLVTIIVLAPLGLLLAPGAFLPPLLFLGLPGTFVVLLLLSYRNFTRPPPAVARNVETFFKAAAACLAVMLVSGMLVWLAADVATSMKVRRSIEAWREAGFTLDSPELFPPPAPREENAALILEEVIQFSDHAPDEQRTERREREVEKELLRLADEIFSGLEEGDAPSELVEKLGAVLEIPPISRKLAVAREAAEYERFDSYPDYDLGFHLLIPHVGGMRHLGKLLEAEAVFHAARQNWPEAYDSLAVILRLGEFAGDEPFLISELTALAIRHMVFDKLEVFLRVHPPDEATIGHWRNLLAEAEGIEFVKAMAREGTVGGLWLKTEIEAGEFRPSAFLENKPYAEMLDSWVFRPLHKADLSVFMDANLRRLERFHAVQRGEVALDDLREWEENLEENLPWYALVTPHLLHGGARYVEIDFKTSARLDMARTAFAAHAYRAAKNEWPQSLEDLVPDYLSNIPPDPFADEPLRYTRDNDRVVLYSVGPNGEDDGGLQVEKPNRGEPGDIVWVLEE